MDKVVVVVVLVVAAGAAGPTKARATAKRERMQSRTRNMVVVVGMVGFVGRIGVVAICGLGPVMSASDAWVFAAAFYVIVRVVPPPKRSPLRFIGSKSKRNQFVTLVLG